MNWKSAVETISEGTVMAGVYVHSDTEVTWAVADSGEQAWLNYGYKEPRPDTKVGTSGKVLKGRCEGEGAYERAVKAAEDAFYSYLDVKKMRQGVV